MKVLIYTAVFKNYDRLQEPDRKFKLDDAVDLMCFSDEETTVPEGWNKQIVEDPERFSPRQLNRALKMTPERFFHTGDYDILVYLDGSMTPRLKLVRSVLEWINRDGYQAVLCRHPVRFTVEAEIDECVRQGKLSKADAERVRPTLMRQNTPLWAGGFFARRQGCLLGAHWWQQCMGNDCWRDQLTLPRAVYMWGREDELKTLSMDVWNNPYWAFRRHGT